MRRFDSVDDFSVTVAAGLLGDLPAVRFDLNIVLVAAGGEERTNARSRWTPWSHTSPMKFAGVWQLLQVATARCDDFSQPSNCSRITWQLAQAAGSSCQIGPTLGIGKSVGANADSDADHDSEQNALESVRGFIYASQVYPVIERLWLTEE